MKVSVIDLFQSNPMALSQKCQWAHYTIPTLDITECPPIAVPAHIGISVFTPEMYDYIIKIESHLSSDCKGEEICMLSIPPQEFGFQLMI